MKNLSYPDAIPQEEDIKFQFTLSKNIMRIGLDKFIINEIQFYFLYNGTELQLSSEERGKINYIGSPHKAIVFDPLFAKQKKKLENQWEKGKEQKKIFDYHFNEFRKETNKQGERAEKRKKKLEEFNHVLDEQDNKVKEQEKKAAEQEKIFDDYFADFKKKKLKELNDDEFNRINEKINLIPDGSPENQFCKNVKSDFIIWYQNNGIDEPNTERQKPDMNQAENNRLKILQIRHLGLKVSDPNEQILFGKVWEVNKECDINNIKFSAYATFKKVNDESNYISTDLLQKNKFTESALYNRYKGYRRRQQKKNKK